MKTLEKPSNNTYLIYNATSINIQHSGKPSHFKNKLNFLHSFFDLSWLLKIADFKWPEASNIQAFSLIKTHKNSQTDTRKKGFQQRKLSFERETQPCTCCLCGSHEPPRLERSKPMSSNASSVKNQRDDGDERNTEESVRIPCPFKEECIKSSVRWNCKCKSGKGPPLQKIQNAPSSLASSEPDLSDKECQVKCTAAIERLQQEIERLEHIIQYGESSKTITTQTAKHKKTQQSTTSDASKESSEETCEERRVAIKNKESTDSIPGAKRKKCFCLKKHKSTEKKSQTVSKKSDHKIKKSKLRVETQPPASYPPAIQTVVQGTQPSAVYPPMIQTIGKETQSPVSYPPAIQTIVKHDPVHQQINERICYCGRNVPDSSIALPQNACTSGTCKGCVCANSRSTAGIDDDQRQQIRRQIRLMEDVVEELDLQRKDVKELKMMLEKCISLIQKGVTSELIEYRYDQHEIGEAPSRGRHGNKSSRKNASTSKNYPANPRVVTGTSRSINSPPGDFDRYDPYPNPCKNYSFCRGRESSYDSFRRPPMNDAFVQNEAEYVYSIHYFFFCRNNNNVF